MDRTELYKEKISLLIKNPEVLNRLSKGFPIKEEDWKYTRLNSLVDFLTQPEEFKEVSSINPFLDFNDNIIILNGKIHSNNSKVKLLQNNFETTQDFVSDLNLGLNQEQLTLNLDSDSEISISFITSNSISAPRLNVICHSDSTLVINLHGVTDEYFSNYLLNLEIAENKLLKIIIIQEDQKTSFSFSTINAELKTKSKLEIYSFSFGGKITRNNISVLLNGENSDAKLFGLNILDSDQHIDNHTVLDHAVPNCESTEIYKGVYNDQSKGIFDGTIIVRKDAQKTNAIQKNQSILLSDDSKSYAKPQLKIWADDVKCTHGATVGQLDLNALFYLQARGIEKSKAKSMLIEAFCSEITENIENESLKSYLLNIINKKLSKE